MNMCERWGMLGVAAVAAALLIGVPAATAATVPDDIAPGLTYGVGGDTGAAGEVETPEGLGLDPISGRIALADYPNDRVSVFSGSGTFLFAFGEDVDPGGGTGPEVCTATCKAGVASGAAGGLHDPEDVEFSPDGKRMFVADSANRRISVFSADGSFERAFGKDVDPGGGTGPEICTTVCQAGAAYDETGGSFAQTWPLSFGPDGNVYVADTSANRISVHRPDGSWLRVFGRGVLTGGAGGFEVCEISADCKTGSITGETGSIYAPEGLDFTPDGELWVSAYSADMLVRYGIDPPTALGALGKDVAPGGGAGLEQCTDPCQPGTPGAGDGEFKRPQGVAIDGIGRIYVSDSSNARISAYDADGSFLVSFGEDVAQPAGGGFELCTALCQAGIPSTANGGVASPYGLAVNCRGTIFVNNADAGPIPARAYGPDGGDPDPCRLANAGVKPNTKKGTARLFALVPYPSRVTLKGPGLRRAGATHTGMEGRERLKVEPKGKLARRLRKRGKARVQVTLTMRPTDGNAVQTATRKLRLKRR